MDGNVKRRSSILKPQQPLQMGVHEASENSVTANMIRRRVSFHNMRTVQEFDRERNDITRSPQKEPIKLGDTGSSDGLHSSRTSSLSHTGPIDRTENDKPGGENDKAEGGLNQTVENFLPLSTSTPVPRDGLKDDSSWHDTKALFAQSGAFDPHDEESLKEEPKDEAGFDSNATFRLFQSSASICCTSAAASNATRALFGPAPSGYTSNIEYQGEESDEDMTRQLFDFPATKEPSCDMNAEDTRQLFQTAADDSELTVNLFKMSIQEAARANVPSRTQNHDESNVEMKDCSTFTVDEVSTLTAVSEGKQLTGTSVLENARDTTVTAKLVGISVLENAGDAAVTKMMDESSRRLENTLLRSADSPLAVLKKRSRTESPLRHDLPMPSRFSNSSDESPKPLQRSILLTPLRESFVADGFMDQTEGTFALSPELQAIAKTKRRIRQSLDRSNRSALFSSPMVMLQDIMRPKRVSMSPMSEQASDRLLESTNQSPSRLASIFQSFNNERVPEPSYMSSFGNSPEAISNLRNESCAVTCRFDSIDFDIKIGEVPCFHKDATDHPIVARLRDVAWQNICRGIAALNAEREHQVQDDLDRLVGHNRRLANAIRMLNPTKLPRNEARAFEACRLKAQIVWYELRNEVALQAVAKADELINERLEVYQKQLRELTVLEKSKSVTDAERQNVEIRLKQLRDIEQLAMAGFEKNKVELASIREAIDNKEIESIQLRTKIAVLETKRIKNAREEIASMRTRADEAISSIEQRIGAARQNYLEKIASIGDL